jgi:two-component system, cell cycle response regulator
LCEYLTSLALSPVTTESVRFNVTATFGVAGSESGELKEFDALLRKADEMLYEAKRAGRNCVRVAKLA